MKVNLKSNKGITMIVLSIAIIILAIVTSMLAYYSLDAIEIKKLNNMYNDIEVLEQKVSLYYYDNEKIPVLIEYPGASDILLNQKSNLDNGVYYVLDLSKLKNVELNFGKSFKEVKSSYLDNDFDIEEYTDLYIINEESHNIYYVKGMTIDGKTYHIRPQTNEEQIEIKTTKISSIEDLIRFQQNVTNGKTYENEYVILTKNLDFENTNSYDGTEVTIDDVIYTYGGEKDLQAYFSKGGTGWTPIGDDTTSFSGIFEGENYKLINVYTSTEENKLLFYRVIGRVQNISVEWKNDNNNTVSGAGAKTIAWIPKGFSHVTGTTFDTGLVMANTTDGTVGTQNYVWIEVPTTIETKLEGDTTPTKLSEAENDEEIMAILEAYAGNYTKGSSGQDCSSWEDEWYDRYNATWDGESEYAYIGVSTSDSESIDNIYPFTNWNAYYGGEVYTNTKKDGTGTMEKVDFATATYSGETYYFAKVNENFKNHTDGCGMTYNEYQTALSKMLNSIKTYGGFWLAQYEAGIAYEAPGTTATNRTSSSPRITKATSANYAKDQYPYNYVYCSEAQKIANADSTNEYTSSLPFGIQWDLVCKFLQVKNAKTYSEIATNSTWGNYYNTSYAPSSTAKYSTDRGSKFNPVVANGTTYSKTATGSVLLTTGAIDKVTVNSTEYIANPMNIYDFAGNVYEWTLERAAEYPDYFCANRGGEYNAYYGSSGIPASYRDYYDITNGDSYGGFRSVLY